MLWNWVSGTWIPALGVILAIALGAICAIPAIGRPAGRMLDKIRDPSPHNRFVASVLLAAATTLFLIFTATFYGRYLRPVWHDEFAYTLQTHMLAHGRLWMAPHPVGEFFESFYILHQPKYASLYFPGVALLYVWAIVLSLPLWIAAAMVAGITVGLFYRVTTELLDGVAGAVGAIILLSLAQFQEMALLVMAQVPMLLFALMMIWAFLRWRQRQGAGWALVLGCAAGWAAIIRPVDAICWAMPIGLAMLWDLKGKNLRTWVRSLGPLAAGATPFLILQVIFNVGVTGSAWKTPWQYYVDRDVPGGGVGIHKFDPSLRPQSTLPQKQDFYQKFIVPSLQSNDAAHLGVALDQRIHSVFDIGLPNVRLAAIGAGWTGGPRSSTLGVPGHDRAVPVAVPTLSVHHGALCLAGGPGRHLPAGERHSRVGRQLARLPRGDRRGLRDYSLSPLSADPATGRRQGAFPPMGAIARGR